MRQAVRSLMRTPTVTFSAILCLALGLGVTAAVSSAVDRALLQPLPFREPDQLLTIYRTTPQANTFPFSAPNYTDISQASRLVASMAALTPNSALVTLPNSSVKAARLRVTGNLFSLLAISPLHGRLLSTSDDSQSENRVVMLSEAFWRKNYGADVSLVSKTIQVDGQAVTVAGILPVGFRVPNGSRPLSADIWEPMRFSTNEMSQRRSNFLYVIGRLAPNANLQTANGELTGIFKNVIAANPLLAGDGVRAVSMREESLASVRTPLLLLFGAVCMVLLISSTNVASMLLARGVKRQRELAVRTALGASRWDVMKPVLTESILLALAGVIAGLSLARIGVHTIGKLAEQRIPQLAGLTVDLRIVLFAVVLGVVVSVFCGIAPAWQGTKVDPQDALRGGRGGGASRAHHRALGGLVVAQVALSLVLLIGAGLVLKGFTTLLGNDPGFNPNGVLTIDVAISPQQYADQSVTKRFLEPALAAVRQIPGVKSAGAISLMPYRDWGWNFNIRYEGQPEDNPTQHALVEQRIVTPGFFEVTQQRLIAGRLLGDADDSGDKWTDVAVVNEALVKRDFKDGNAIGKRYYTGDSSFSTIVGVVSNIRNVGPVSAPIPEAYHTYRQYGNGSTGFAVVVRTQGVSPNDIAVQVQNAMRSVDRTVAITRVMPMTEVISASVGRPRFLFSLIGVFAVVAVVLAMAGLYGVMSYAVEQRTREIGIRTALGSTPGATIRFQARQGMVLLVLGSAVGLACCGAVTRLMVSMLYGVSPLDVSTWIYASLAMIAAGTAATILPSIRATRVDPLVAIRTE